MKVRRRVILFVMLQYFTMNALPRGITGFWSIKGSLPPSTDQNSFLAYCHTVAQQFRGNVIASKGEKYPRNFTFSTLQTPNETISILLNGQFPFLAIARPLDEDEMTIEFFDAPAVAAEFRKFDCYNILTASELSGRATEKSLSELSEAELDQIKYWKPETIGEIVFNFWD